MHGHYFYRECFPFQVFDIISFSFYPVLHFSDDLAPSTSCPTSSTTTSFSSDPVDSSSDVTPATSSPPHILPPRRSTRTTKTLVWLDYYGILSVKTACLYLVSQYVSSSKLSPFYGESLAAYLAIMEPKSYIESCLDPLWVETIKTDITALEDNCTWYIVPLPPDKTPDCCKWALR